MGFFTGYKIRTYQEYPDLTDVSVPDYLGGSLGLRCHSALLGSENWRSVLGFLTFA